MKLTPLNIISSIGLVAGVMLMLSPKPALPIQGDMNTLVVVLIFLTAVIAFISDLIFRKFIPQIKRLWIIESALIAFTIILIIILKISTT